MKSCWIRAVNPLGGSKKYRDTGTQEHKGRGWSDAAKPKTYEGFLAVSGR